MSSASAPSVLVVGAGVVGASVAWHLAARGETNVLVIDAAPGPGAGSTGRAVGGFRGQFATEPNVRLSMLAREKLLRFRDEVGADPGYREVGYLFLAHDRAALDALREARAVQHACGLTQATELTPEQAQAINPHVLLAGAVGASWCPTDGTTRPLQIMQGYLDDATRRGVRVQWDTRVTAIERDAAGRVTLVRTTRGDLAPGAVVNAAGPWAGQLAALAGVDLPVRPVRRQIGVADPAPGMPLPEDFPMTIWTSDVFHLRVRDGRALLNWPVDTPSANGDPEDLTVHRPWVDEIWEKARGRVPALRDGRLDDSAHYVGLYEMSPDKTLILGVAPGCPNMVLANGSSGHGVMHSPATGQLVSEILLDGRATAMDVHALRPERFAEGEPLPMSSIL
jgi:sarcosine oxidase, subunit beta